MFEKASRLKLRFTTTKGMLTVEDLWDLPLTSQRGISLDGIARGLYHEVNESKEISFVIKETDADTELKLMFDIVKHVIKTRLEESENKRLARARKEKKEKILEIIAKKQDGELEGKSIEELTALIS